MLTNFLLLLALNVGAYGNTQTTFPSTIGSLTIGDVLAFGTDATIAADDTTPDVSTATYYVTSANTVPTAITDIDLPVVGATYVLCGGSNTNSSTIADAGNFALNSAVTLSLDACIALHVQADNDYVEIGRTNAGGWVGTATSDLNMDAYAVNIGAGGVKLSGDGDGALTFLSLGNGSGGLEDLTFNFDDTANTVSITSSTGVTIIDLSSGIRITGAAGSAASPSYNFASGGADTGMFSDSTDYLRFATAGTEALRINAAAEGRSVEFKGTYWQIGLDPADTGVARLANAAAIAWEASPTGTDVTLQLDSSERVVIAGNSGVILPIQQADLTASCTLGEWGYDTGGSIDELCYCQATNVWMCATVTAGPAD